MKHGKAEEYREVGILVVVGDSWRGKTTLGLATEEAYPQMFTNSISATDRERRDDEIHGKDYYFLSSDAFDNPDDFLECGFFGNNYGTLKSEVKRAWEEGKILVLILDPYGADNVLNNLNSVEIEGNTYSLPREKKQLVILDISEEKVMSVLNAKINKSENPEIWQKEVDRVKRGDLGKDINKLGLKDIEDAIIRTDFFPEGYVGDILARTSHFLPKNSDYVNFRLSTKEKENLFLEYALETLYELSPLNKKELEMTIVDSSLLVDDKILREASSRYSVEPQEVIDFAKEKIMFPLYFNSSDGVTSDRCRFSNKSLISESLCDWIEENMSESTTTRDVFECVSVDVHTRHGFESTKLSDIQGVSVSDFSLPDSLVSKLKTNDIIQDKIEKLNNKKKRIGEEPNQTINLKR